MNDTIRRQVEGLKATINQHAVLILARLEVSELEMAHFLIDRRNDAIVALLKLVENNRQDDDVRCLVAEVEQQNRVVTAAIQEQLQEVRNTLARVQRLKQYASV